MLPGSITKLATLQPLCLGRKPKARVATLLYLVFTTILQTCLKMVPTISYLQLMLIKFYVTYQQSSLVAIVAFYKTCHHNGIISWDG